jgi:CheY-like chemotaxis protein
MTPEHSTSTILVVEDEALPRLELIDALSCAGYEVLEASNAHEAFGYLQHQRQIDVVITDIQLGDDLTGWDVAEKFRAERPNIPIVYTSGTSGDRRRSVPGSVFFRKPYRSWDILKVCSGFGGAPLPQRDTGSAL